MTNLARRADMGAVLVQSVSDIIAKRHRQYGRRHQNSGGLMEPLVPRLVRINSELAGLYGLRDPYLAATQYLLALVIMSYEQSV